jgi:site-specific DNA recombinase
VAEHPVRQAHIRLCVRLRVPSLTRFDRIRDQLSPAKQRSIVRLLVEKVIVSPNDIEVRLRANGIEELALELCPAVLEAA